MSVTWSAGKKSAVGLDHWSYYWIVSTEISKTDRIVANRSRASWARMRVLTEEMHGYGRRTG